MCILQALNYNYLYAINSWLLLNPWWLCFDWSMGCVPVITSLTDPRLLPLAAFLFVMGCLFICCFKIEMDHEDRYTTIVWSVRNANKLSKEVIVLVLPLAFLLTSHFLFCLDACKSLETSFGYSCPQAFITSWEWKYLSFLH